MQSEQAVFKDWNLKNKKSSSGKERRNSYHGQRKNNKKRSNSYSKSFESKESLPEWVTHEGVWDIETQDPVKEFIRAIALDEGYATCENTVTDEIKTLSQAKLNMSENVVPDWDDGFDLYNAEWVNTEDLDPRECTPTDEELYAKFQAKFNSSIEALWSKDQNTPDDEYQDLPIDFQDLLSSPSDRLFAVPSAEKCSLISLTESIWSIDAADLPPPPERASPALHDRLRPLNLADAAEPQPREIESFALYEEEELYDAVASVAHLMRSYAAINHSRDCSGFVEVLPRRHRDARRTPPAPAPGREPLRRTPSRPREDLLTSARTHFRPIRRDSDADPPRYADGDTFDICCDPDPVEFQRSESGGAFLGEGSQRYLEYRGARGSDYGRGIDYGRLNLTAEQRCPDLEEPGLRLRFPLRQCDVGTQTEDDEAAGSARGWTACVECRAAKRMRASTVRSIWSERACRSCAAPRAEPRALPRAPPPPADELSRDWEELLSDISAAHAQYAGGGEADEARADRKRRHSAALRCAAQCTHPHARFLPCCTLALDRPLTR